MSTEKSKILVVGGYGAVGSVITKELAGEFPGQVVVAGRDLHMAEEFVRQEKLKATPAIIDIQTPLFEYINFDVIHTAICCVEIPAQSALLEKCIETAVNYVEIGTSYECYEKFFSYEGRVKEAGITVIPSVGLLPGLSNVFAYEALRHFKNIKEVQTYIMLGMGDEHGLDAIRWMLAYANRSFTLKNQAGREVKQSFSEPHSMRFLHESKKRTFYLFDFADQHTIPLSTGAQRAETRLAFDARLVTYLLYLMKKVGLLKGANRWNPVVLKKMLDMFKLGRSDFALQVDIKGVDHEGSDQELSYLVYGQHEAYATGLVGAFTVKNIIGGSVLQGLIPIEKALPFSDLVNYLSGKGLHFKASDKKVFNTLQTDLL